MSISTVVLIIGMAIVTYIPRCIPVLLMDKMTFSPKLEKFLQLIPYTAMAALIFPNVLWVDSTSPYVGIVGGLVAGILAWKKYPVMICVLAAIASNFLLLAFFY